jgi:ketosteroid isomerase-like protein
MTMTLILPLTLSLSLSLAVPAATRHSADEAAVVQALHRACEAFRTGEASFLVGFLDEHFTLTDTAGRVTTREENLAEVRKREPRYEVFRNHSMKTRIYGETAVVNGITSLKGTAGGTPFEADVQFTDTLVKRDGTWRLVASHVSPLPRPPKTP